PRPESSDRRTAPRPEIEPPPPAFAAEPEVAPPGSRAPAFVQTLRWIFRPEAFMRRNAERYGDTFTVSLGPGVNVIFLSDPATVGQVLQAPPEITRMGDINGLFRPILGAKSLLLLDGDEHLRQRRLLLPPFHGEHVQRYMETMERAAREEVDTWAVGRPFALLPRLQAIALNVILRAVFGMDAGPRRDEMRALVARLLELCQSRSTMLPQLRVRLGGLSPWGRLMRCVGQVDEALFAEIARRRADPDSPNRGDVLSLLLATRDEEGEPMTDQEVRDQLLTLLVAGHETTASAIAWAFERLLHRPETLARLVEELAAGREDYLDAVVKETLRLRPVLPIVARKLTEPFRLEGYRYDRGTVLMPCVFLVHRNPKVYDDPEEFHPERFLAQPPPTYAWIPFGGGVRRCLGASFALAEMRAVLRTVLTRVELGAPGRPERIARRSFTFSPRRGARVVVRGRLAPPDA
ncbi:MAG: cytochrome P450, partial [Actinomycetota bacterium]|nr:cytochrome P450 [Actinomycetota bacterium]